MPQARITVNGFVGSNADLTIATFVQFNNQNIGGEATFNWFILDQPPGAVDALSADNIQNPSITLNKEGSYRIKLTVNLGQASEVSNIVVVAVRQLKSRVRIPAAGEVTDVDADDGWATDVDTILRKVDVLLSDPGVFVGVAGVGGLARNDVLKISGYVKIKTALPGEERVPSFTKAIGTDPYIVRQSLFVLEGGVDGNNNPSNGALVRARFVGPYGPINGAGAAIDEWVFVSDGGLLIRNATGTIQRRIGRVIGVDGGAFYAWIDGPAFTGSTAIVNWGAGSALADGVLNFMFPGFGIQTDVLERKLRLPFPCRIDRMKVRCDTNNATENVTFTLRKNGVDTGLAATLTPVQTFIDNLTNFTLFAENDDMSLSAQSAGVSAASPIQVVVSLALTPYRLL